jgi:hypothetical protein
LQERGKRKDPLIFPANSPKNSRNGIGCIQRNPTKGIESNWEGSNGWKSPERCVAFKEIPQRELRVDSMRAMAANTTGCIQRNPTKGIESGFAFGYIFNTFSTMLHSKKSHKGN